MALKDWKKQPLTDMYCSVIYSWLNEQEDSSLDILKGQHVWEGVGSHEEYWSRQKSNVGFQVSLIANLEHNGGYPKWSKTFNSKSQALKFARSYMRKH